jgi:predicted dehydrogenase
MSGANVQKLGLIGAGRWGRRYIATLSGMHGVALASLVSANADSKSLVSSSCRIFGTWRDCLAAGGIDGLIVAAPPAVHFDIASAAVAAGIPVLVEKPLTLAAAQSRALLELSEAHGVMVMVGHTHLFSPAYRAVRGQLSRVGQLRRLVLAAGAPASARQDVSALWDWAPHDLAMALDLLPGQMELLEAELVDSRATDSGPGATVRLRLRGGGDVEVDIRVSSIAAEKHRRLEIHGDAGRLIYDDLHARKAWFELPAGTDDALDFPAEMPLTRQMHDFCDAIVGRQASHASLQLGHRVVALLEHAQALLDGVPARQAAGASYA